MNNKNNDEEIVRYIEQEDRFWRMMERDDQERQKRLDDRNNALRAARAEKDRLREEKERLKALKGEEMIKQEQEVKQAYVQQRANNCFNYHRRMDDYSELSPNAKDKVELYNKSFYNVKYYNPHLTNDQAKSKLEKMSVRATANNGLVDEKRKKLLRAVRMTYDMLKESDKNGNPIKWFERACRMYAVSDLHIDDILSNDDMLPTNSQVQRYNAQVQFEKEYKSILLSEKCTERQAYRRAQVRTGIMDININFLYEAQEIDLLEEKQRREERFRAFNSYVETGLFNNMSLEDSYNMARHESSIHDFNWYTYLALRVEFHKRDYPEIIPEQAVEVKCKMDSALSNYEYTVKAYPKSQEKLTLSELAKLKLAFPPMPRTQITDIKVDIPEELIEFDRVKRMLQTIKEKTLLLGEELDNLAISVIAMNDSIYREGMFDVATNDMVKFLNKEDSYMMSVVQFASYSTHLVRHVLGKRAQVSFKSRLKYMTTSEEYTSVRSLKLFNSYLQRILVKGSTYFNVIADEAEDEFEVYMYFIASRYSKILKGMYSEDDELVRISSYFRHSVDFGI